eukprot:9963720-Alexandrium_andersonii.AAC.1
MGPGMTSLPALDRTTCRKRLQWPRLYRPTPPDEVAEAVGRAAVVRPVKGPGSTRAASQPRAS